MYRSGRLAALLAGALIAAAANAQAPVGQSSSQTQAKSADQAPSAPLYQVEIIVFAYNDADPTQEVFRDAPPPNPNSAFEDGLLPLQTLDADAGAELSSLSGEAQAAETDEASTAAESGGAAAPASALNPGTASSEDSASATALNPGTASAPNPAASETPNGETPSSPPPLIGPRGFSVLGADSLTLDAAYAKIGRLGAYTPLLHAAWIQPALPENQAPSISMTDLGALNPMGSIHVYESRYLHVTIDLSYQPTSAQLAELEQVSLARSQSNSEGADEALNEISLGPNLTMKTSRRVDAGKLQYFDHPYFGVLVLITPYEPQNERQAGVKPAA